MAPMTLSHRPEGAAVGKEVKEPTVDQARGEHGHGTFCTSMIARVAAVRGIVRMDDDEDELHEVGR
jgi:hypothetical protein